MSLRKKEYIDRLVEDKKIEEYLSVFGAIKYRRSKMVWKNLDIFKPCQ